MTFTFSLYKEQYSDGSNSAIKWSCPNIHDLKDILEKVQIDKILHSICDKRLTSLKDLPVVQLRDECEKLNLSKKGRKVVTIELMSGQIEIFCKLIIHHSQYLLCFF